MTGVQSKAPNTNISLLLQGRPLSELVVSRLLYNSHVEMVLSSLEKGMERVRRCYRRLSLNVATC